MPSPRRYSMASTPSFTQWRGLRMPFFVRARFNNKKSSSLSSTIRMGNGSVTATRCTESVRQPVQGVGANGKDLSVCGVFANEQIPYGEHCESEKSDHG